MFICLPQRKEATMYRQLELYFRGLSQIEEDAKDPTTWSKYSFTKDNVEEMAHKHINEEPDDSVSSLEYRLASSSPSISDAYRFNQEYCSEFDIFEKMLRNYITTAPIILFRGASSVPYEKMIEAAKELGDPNITFYEKGFLSCSLLPECASKFTRIKQFQIFCPPGNSLFYVGHLIDDEEPNGIRYECIVQRGAKLQLIYEDQNYYYCLLKSTV